VAASLTRPAPVPTLASVPIKSNSQTLRITIAVLVILGTVAYLAVSGVQANKSYYVTIKELDGLGNKAYTRHLRVAGNVSPGSIHHVGPAAQFVLVEEDRTLKVDYQGTEPPPDTFKDNAQALAIGTYGRDGIFHATQVQAKCASKYAPAKPGEKPAMTPATTGTASLNGPLPPTAN
jgi:cytochrome c-type biogenesis protein CcmE